MLKEYILPYGKDQKSLFVPEENVIAYGGPKDAPAIDVALQVRNALEEPINMQPLADCIPENGKVVVIVDDYTRPTPASEILPSLIDYLNQKGIPDKDISILIAAGIHRSMTKAELLEKIGEQIYQRIEIHQHDGSDKAQMAFCGETSKGTPVWLNRHAAEADFRIGIGLVEAHAYAGFSGGPKIMMPGIAAKETIFHHHGNLAVSDRSRFGVTDGNPFWEDLVEVAQIGKLDFIVNIVLNRDGEIAFLHAGEPVETQRASIEQFMTVYGVEVPEPADLVIASANPKYWYFDQSNVAMLNAANVVKDGGIRIIAAECPENFGPDIIRRLYLESFGRENWLSDETYLQELKDGKYDYELADAPAIYKLIKAEKCAHMIFVSCKLDPKDAETTHTDLRNNLQAAVDDALQQLGPGAKIAILPFGSMSLPYLSQSANEE